MSWAQGRVQVPGDLSTEVEPLACPGGGPAGGRQTAARTRRERALPARCAPGRHAFPRSPRGLVSPGTDPAPLPGAAEGPVRSHGHASGLAEADQVLLSEVRVALDLRGQAPLTEAARTPVGTPAPPPTSPAATPSPRPCLRGEGPGCGAQRRRPGRAGGRASGHGWASQGATLCGRLLGHWGMCREGRGLGSARGHLAPQPLGGRQVLGDCPVDG